MNGRGGMLILVYRLSIGETAKFMFKLLFLYYSELKINTNIECKLDVATTLVLRTFVRHNEYIYFRTKLSLNDSVITNRCCLIW